MKKLQLRAWVIYLLIGINTLAVLVLGAEVEDTFIFIISKLVALGTFMINNYILFKYTELFKD